MNPPPDLLSLSLTLRPVAAENERLPHLGKAAHAVLLDAVRQLDPQLSAEIHAGEDVPRPFTTSNLIGYSARHGLNPEPTACA